MTRIFRHHRLAHVVLAIAIALSIAAWLVSAKLVGRQASADFDARAQASLGSMERKAQRYIDVLHGLEGLFGHDPSISRRQFRHYVGALNVESRFPGIQAIAFVRRVTDGNKAVYESVVRNDRSLEPAGYPDFAIRPAGVRNEYFVVHYIEPMPANAAAFGLDILARDGARDAAIRARDMGEPIATSRVPLQQGATTQPGLIIYLPIYETLRTRRTAEQRHNELAGLVSIVFRIDDFFRILIEPDEGKTYRVRVHDLGPSGAPLQEPLPANLLYASSGDAFTGASAPTSDGDEATKQFVMAGRQWLVQYASIDARGNPIWHPLSLIVLSASLLIAGLLFWSLRTLSRSREAAMQMADSATRELRDQLSFSQQLLEALPNPVFYKDAKGRYLGCNHAFEAFTNRPRAEYIGRTVLEVTTSEAAKTHHEIETELLRNHGSKTYELSLTRTTDGRQIDAVYNKATFVDGDGRVAGLVGVVIDITERKNLERTLSDRNEKLRSIIEASPLAIIARDLEGRISLWNPAAERLFGWKADEVVGTTQSIVPADIRADVAEMRRQVERGMMLSLEETRRMRKDGVVLDVSLSVAPIHDARGSIVGTMVLIADISRRKQAEIALRESETQLRLAMEAADMGSWFWNLDAGKFSCSDGFGPLFGLPRATFFAEFHEFLAAIHVEDRAAVASAVREALKRDLQFDMECRVVWPDRSEHWLAVRGQVTRNAIGRAERIIGVLMDITTRKQAEQRIAYMAHHDALTQLPNRVLLQDRIAHAIALSHRNDTQVAVLFIDLDHFKTINDSLGHQLGDELLQQVAQRLRANLRELDTVSRLGGDEFVIVVPELVHAGDATAVAIKLLDALAAPFHVQAQDLHVSASIGISVCPADGENAETLMRNADTAMYHAKERGRSQYQYFTGEMNEAAQQRMSLQVSLRRALQLDEFSLHYQPVFLAQDQRLIGFEALLRWQRQDGRTVFPGEFISVAEDSGLIVPIGEWVIQEACRTAAAWHARGHRLKVAINVSAVQLRRKSFAGVIKAALADTGADPHLIEMEITERVIVGGHEEAIVALRQIDALGIQIAIDDFGTGYSGLSYLKQFPIDTVKIDQSFIHLLTDDADDTAIVRAIIAMSKSLKLNVVAEGVEHAAQVAMLQELGCDMVQGYYFGRPLPLVEADAFIEQSFIAGKRRQA